MKVQEDGGRKLQGDWAGRKYKEIESEEKYKGLGVGKYKDIGP